MREVEHMEQTALTSRQRPWQGQGRTQKCKETVETRERSETGTVIAAKRSKRDHDDVVPDCDINIAAAAAAVAAADCYCQLMVVYGIDAK
jgi:hypothetical protein